MNAFHGNAALKSALLAEVEKHELADQIVSGTYGETRGGKWVGCAVGCSLHSLAAISGRKLNTANHSLYEPEVGVPQMLARLQDTIFEGLPADLQKAWPRRFWNAVPVGADLSTVGWKFLHWLLTQSGIGAYDHKSVHTAVAQCAEVLLPLTRGEPVNDLAARSAAWSARSAAWSAESARSAAWSAESARSAARSAWSAAESAESARSAARSAESAAESAESARSARSAAWSAAYTTMADQLTKLLEAA